MVKYFTVASCPGYLPSAHGDEDIQAQGQNSRPRKKISQSVARRRQHHRPAPRR